MWNGFGFRIRLVVFYVLRCICMDLHSAPIKKVVCLRSSLRGKNIGAWGVPGIVHVGIQAYGIQVCP